MSFSLVHSGHIQPPKDSSCFAGSDPGCSVAILSLGPLGANCPFWMPAIKVRNTFSKSHCPVLTWVLLLGELIKIILPFFTLNLYSLFLAVYNIGPKCRNEAWILAPKEIHILVLDSACGILHLPFYLRGKKKKKKSPWGLVPFQAAWRF